MAIKKTIDQLAMYWQGEKQEKEVAIVPYLRNLREKLSSVRELASENESKAKSCHKLYHDRKAKNRNFEVGDQVLVFRLRKLNKLINEWKGPMTIVRKLTNVSYEVSAGQDPRSLRVYHVNGMKAWHSPVPSALVATECTTALDPGPMIEEGTNLTTQQQNDLDNLVDEY